MYSVYILLAVGLISLAIAIFGKCGKDSNAFCTYLMVGVFCTLMCWAPPLLLGGAEIACTKVETIDRTNILCLKDNSNVKGTLSIFTASFNEQMYYYYYVQDLDDAVTLEKLPTRVVKLYEDAPTDTGYVLEYRIVYEANKTSNWIFRPSSHRERIEIHVPPGTVSRQFILDAE